MKLVKILIATILCSNALAWEPTKPITVLIGNKPGSGNEIAFRLVSSVVSKSKPDAKFVIELKPGADSAIALNQLYESKPDGYTIGVPSHMSTYVTNDIWQKDIKKFSYDSFENVITLGQSPLTIVANSSSAVNTIDDLVKLLKTTERPITFAVGGGAHRMAYETLMNNAKGNRDLVKFTQFPGPLQAVTSVASEGTTEFGIMPITIAMPLIQAGKVKPLGITGTKSLSTLPNVKPIIINGKSIDVMAGWVIALPPGTPKDIVEWYRKNFSKAIQSKEVQDYYNDNYIITDKNQLNPKGVNSYILKIRQEYMPMANILTTE